jgi:general secretion pathway protein K
VALIAVLWLVAAMGLIITGIVNSVRSEVQIAGLQRQTLMASARADAAILLALQNLHSQQIEPRNLTLVIPVQFEGITSAVTLQPLNGLIDINNATPLLLTELFRHAGGLSPETAQTLAQSTIETRQIKSIGGAAQGFEATEDIMRVPKMTYNLYAKIKDLVTVDLKEGSGRVNPMLAPMGVIQVLTGGDVSRATSLVAQSNASPNAMDTSFLKPEFIEITSSHSLRLQVSLALPDGGSVKKAWQVYWGPDPRSGLPWRVLASQLSMQHPAQPAN